MNSLKDKILRSVFAGHKAEPPARWQQRKSAQTRLRLIEAGVECLVDNGYPGLTIAAVAERCEVSRGAMHHHFATRMDLVAAVIEHVFYRRMAAFLEDYFEAMTSHGEDELIEMASEAHWRSVQSPDYAAYLALAMAARTDRELAALFDPAAQNYDAVWTSEMIKAFPEWRENYEDLKLSSDFTMALHMGLLLHRPAFVQEARIEKVLRFAAESVKAMYVKRK